MNWISVNDRLPDDGDYVLTSNPYKFMFGGVGCVMKALIYMCDDCAEKGWYNEDSGEMVDGVIHWMPLTKPPCD